MTTRQLLSWCGTAVAASCSLLLYMLTLARNVGPVDGGELTLAAWELGVPHPPGFPLYVLAAHAVASIPIGSVAARVNFASALFATIAAAALFQLTVQCLGFVLPKDGAATPERKQTRAASEAAASGMPDWPVFGGALVAALLFCSLRTTWSYATVAEVYTLAVCLTILIWLLMLRPTLARMQIAAALFGLALGAHPAIVIVMLPALAVLVVRSHSWRFFATRQFAGLFAVAVIGASIYLYLPLAASMQPSLNWGDPQTLDRLWKHISGREYRDQASTMTMAGFVEALRRSGVILAGQVERQPPIALLFVASGIVHAFRRHRTILEVLAALIAANIFITSLMNAGWTGEGMAELVGTADLDAYFFPTLMAGCLFAGIGVASALEASARGVAALPRAATVALVAVVALTAMLQPMAANWRPSNRARDTVPRNYVDDVLQTVGAGGLVLARDWNLLSPMMYVQRVEEIRPDVVALNLNLMEKSWYLGSLLRAFPAVFLPAREELSTLTRLVRAWENDPLPVDQSASRHHGAVGRAFDALLLKVVESHQRRGPVYATFEVATVEGAGHTITGRLASVYQLVPEGLVFALESQGQFRMPAPLKLRIAPLLDAGVGQLSTRHQRIALVYRDMLISRGLYLEANGRCAQAIPVFEQALLIDATSSIARAVTERCGRQPFSGPDAIMP